MFTYHVYNVTAVYQAEPHTGEEGAWRVVTDNIVSMNTSAARDGLIRKHNLPDALSTMIWHIHEITRFDVPNEIGMALDHSLLRIHTNGGIS